jgi:ligand-binding sensor domain-containing protein/serine phosphatase RsbU (regulator of sigma subunit)
MMLKSIGLSINKYIILALLFVSFSSGKAFSQRDAIEFERISVEEGLTQSTIYSILQDHKGFLWFGTDDGLNRYDGYNFKVYSHINGVETSLSNNRVISMIEDSQNTLWIATIGGGLNKFDWTTDSFKSYRSNPNDSNSLSIDRVMTLCEDPSGKIWVGTADGGLNLFDPVNETFKVYINTPQNPDLLPSNVIRSLFIDSNNQLFVGTDNGIATYNSSEDSFTELKIIKPNGTIHEVNIVRRFLEDNNGNIWIATDEEGLVKFNRKENSFTIFLNDPSNKKGLKSNTIHDLYQDENGIIWIATFGGLHKYNPETKQFYSYQHDITDPYSISSNLIRTVFEDNMGVLWIGTYNNGINKYNKKFKKFTVYRNRPSNPFSLPSSTIRAIFEDNKQSIWIGTYGEGLVKFNLNDEQFKQYHYNSSQVGGLPSNYVNSIAQDSSNHLWIATNNGIAKYNFTTGKFLVYNHNPDIKGSLPENRIRNVYFDKNNVLWAASLTQGISRFSESEQTFETFRFDPANANETISQDRVTTMFEDSRGNFWIGTSDEGINLFDRKSGKVVKHFKNILNDTTSISSNRILCFFEDSQQQLWIGTGGGGLNLFNIENETFKNFSTVDGLPNDVVYSILEDKLGRLWVSTNNGLSRVDLSNPNEPYFRNYNKLDGLQNNEFSEGASLYSQSGLMFFGGNENFSVFNPLEVSDNPYPPHVYITEASILNKDTKTDDIRGESINLLSRDSLLINYSQGNITLHFTALHYSVPQKNSYKYMLEGFETSWVEPVENLRFATYTNLKPGKYTFKVIASNPDGVWNDKGDELIIIIEPPYWNTWWFYIFISLTFLAIVYGFVKFREASLIRLKRELEEKVTIRTQEISSQSEEILLQSERLQQANEEIRAKSEVLAEQNKELQAKNDEITIQRNELEEQKNSLANLAWELQDKNEEITAQRNEIEKQKKEITDSIMYAQRIQNAVLPTQEQIRDLFPEFFIFNKPKSIVSGDFYWATRVGKHRIVAVVDCTGHGVPGGFMSMLGVLMLNEVISLRLFIDPARALNQLRQSIISVLHQTGGIDDSADGMDLSLCIINDDDLTLTYAGANSSILIFNPFKEEKDAITEFRSDRMPIGYHLIMKSFSSQTIKLSKGEVIYLYSDGIVDQFGGPQNKKFQHAKLRQFILEHKDLPIETQGIVLEQTFDSWKGNSFQVDDVLVMGLKV